MPITDCQVYRATQPTEFMEAKSNDYSEAFKKFADWLEATEKRLESACYCCPTQAQPQQQTLQPQQQCQLPRQEQQPTAQKSWNHVILYHQKLQNEVEDYGQQLHCEMNRHVNEAKSLPKKEWEKSKELQVRWYKLWLKSLEQLVIVDRRKRCPKHNSTIIGKTSTANRSVARPRRRRPISYPNNFSERLEWDYQHTLSLTGCHKQNGSQIDLDSVDEQATKNLTEFGENYEFWFGEVHSRPPSVEPAEQPELAKAVVATSDCNLLMLTSPSSIISVDARSCANLKRGQNCCFRILGFFIFAVAILLFSALLYQEPHHMHKSYLLSHPPV